MQLAQIIARKRSSILCKIFQQPSLMKIEKITNFWYNIITREVRKDEVQTTVNA
jgi:hypothetical protein